MSIDPVTTDANTGASFNRYAYANNSPYNYIDPDGRNGVLVGIVSGGAVLMIGGYKYATDSKARAVINRIVAAMVSGNKPNILTPGAENHVLNGDQEGGGHRAGTGTPGKTEFPPSWTDGKITGEISDVATDPNSDRKPGRDGATIVEGTRDCVGIRCIVGPDGNIISGWPTKGPGVVQNPNPKPKPDPAQTEPPKPEPKSP